MDPVRLDAALRPGGGFFLFAGPCLLEDDSLNLGVAEMLAEIAGELRIPIVFKASFDKANRSRAGAARGPGLEEGLRRLERVRDSSGLPVLTDIHEPAQAASAAEVCAVLQIPAFLSRQTDLIDAAALTGRPLNLKKGQWMAPEEMAGAVAKARAHGNRTVTVTERGTFLGYGDLVVDMRSFARMREATGTAVVFDGTHSVQRPGMAGGASGGDPEYTVPLVRAAMAAGADGLFLEVHPQPERAPSDSSNMLRLERLRPLLLDVLAIRAALGEAAFEAAGAGAR
ncbi:MAG: 3-deoxy-8-phosphooctulonate synthase [Longimicrobiales bacterium]